jgi:hypothetical protein
MTLCPIALVVGCTKCPAFKVCPVKGVIGDYKEPGPSATAQQTGEAKRDKPQDR